jgi:hypothetical protein
LSEILGTDADLSRAQEQVIYNEKPNLRGGSTIVGDALGFVRDARVKVFLRRERRVARPEVTPPASPLSFHRLEHADV